MEFSKTVQLIFTASFVVGRGGLLMGSDWCWILRILNLIGGMGVWGGVCVGWGGVCVCVCGMKSKSGIWGALLSKRQ